MKHSGSLLVGLVLGALMGGAGAVLFDLPRNGAPSEEPDGSEAPVPEEGPGPRTVRIGEEAQASGRIETAVPRRGSLTGAVVLDAEVAFDETKLARVVPVVGGLIRELPANLGAQVQEGEVVAVIESQDLGEAKSTYLDRQNGLELAQAELDRRREVQARTEEMIDLLATDAAPEQIRAQVDRLRIGEPKAKVMVAYANRIAAHATLEREKLLSQKGVSSQQSYEEARRALEAADAEFQAAVEGFRLSSDLALQEARNKVASAQAALAVSGRHLEILGVDSSKLSAPDGADSAGLARYEVRSPLTGRVVSRSATVGEKITADAELFTVADLTSLWVIGAATEDQRAAIEEGAGVEIVADGLPDQVFRGAVWNLGAALNERTRRLPVRARLSNDLELLRPGMYVRMRVLALPGTDEGASALIVPSAAIQRIDGLLSVFVRLGEGLYSAVPVEVGKGWGGEMEVVSGLDPDQTIVTRGSFLLKAELEKGTMAEEDGD